MCLSHVLKLLFRKQPEKQYLLRSNIYSRITWDHMTVTSIIIITIQAHDIDINYSRITWDHMIVTTIIIITIQAHDIDINYSRVTWDHMTVTSIIMACYKTLNRYGNGTKGNETETARAQQF